eukprot:598469-Amphidinium_carterae.3
MAPPVTAVSRLLGYLRCCLKGSKAEMLTESSQRRLQAPPRVPAGWERIILKSKRRVSQLL